MESDLQPKRFETLPGVPYLNDRKSRGYQLFQKVQGALHHVPDFGETCKAILDAVIEEIDAENCSLMLNDPISGYLAVCAARGKSEKKSIYYPEPSNNGKRFKSGEGIAGWVLKEGQAVMLNDAAKEPRFLNPDGLKNGVKSLICCPIREKDRVAGVLNLSHSRKGAFNEEHKLTLSYISNQVGAALASASFFVEIEGINSLMREPKEVFLEEKAIRIAAPVSSTFVDVSEVTQDEGIFIYASDQMRQIKEIIDQIANTDVTVLIQGESGVGKEVVARCIQLNSFRKQKPFVKVNCAALPQELLESELFGYEKGAFTGAYRQKPGKFELANEGTVFLDEISEMSPSLQSKLLQVLQDREFSRLGGRGDIRVDVRVLAATNKNIEECVKGGRFREDLYHRLNVINIAIPPLRERKEEIPIFVNYFLKKFSKKYRKRLNPLSDELTKVFSQHPWSGNVRELENVIQRLVVLGNEKAIIEQLAPETKKDIVPGVEKQPPPSQKNWPSLKEFREEAVRKGESETILKALQITNGKRKRAVQMLNISYNAFLYKIKGTGLDKRFRDEDTILKSLSDRSLDKINSKEAFNLKALRKRVAEDAEKEIIQNTLLRTHWNRRRAAQLLRVSYRALLYKIEKYRLDGLKRCSKIEDEAG